VKRLEELLSPKSDLKNNGQDICSSPTTNFTPFINGIY
jgi:hypothetical protein